MILSVPPDKFQDSTLSFPNHSYIFDFGTLICNQTNCSSDEAQNMRRENVMKATEECRE
jgi:hypothetical protein